MVTKLSRSQQQIKDIFDFTVGTLSKQVAVKKMQMQSRLNEFQ